MQFSDTFFNIKTISKAQNFSDSDGYEVNDYEHTGSDFEGNVWW